MIKEWWKKMFPAEVVLGFAPPKVLNWWDIRIDCNRGNLSLVYASINEPYTEEYKTKIEVSMSYDAGLIFSLFVQAFSKEEAITKAKVRVEAFRATEDGKRQVREAQDRESDRWFAEIEAERLKRPASKGDFQELIKAVKEIQKQIGGHCG
jgi:hypothetical protein